MLTLRFLPVFLLGLCALVAFGGSVLERRDTAAEMGVQGYLSDVSKGDVEAALARVVPAERGAWRIFVQHQAGDQFIVQSLAVRRPSMIESPGWRGAKSVTVVAEIRGKGGEQWRDTALVEGITGDGKWLLKTPPFAPPEPWLVPPDS